MPLWLDRIKESSPVATQTFNCPSCGAPLEYHDGDPAAIHCPFCENTVVVPPELRPAQSTQAAMPMEGSARPARARGGTVLLVIGMTLLLFVLGITLLPMLMLQTASVPNGEPLVPAKTPLGDLIKSQPPPTPSPTPPFARPALQFGSEGIGPGLLNDARYLGVDAGGTLYVADYQGGRVQAFDSTGKYLRTWMIGNAKTIIHGMAVSNESDVFVAYDTGIACLDGQTGMLVATWSSPNGGEFGDLAMTANGSLAAAWYEGRWGLITSLQGHREDLVVFNAQGKITLTVPSFISAQTGDLALDNLLAVDGLGFLHVLSGDAVYKFSADGKFIDRFGSRGDAPGQFHTPDSIAVDGQGRVFVGDTREIQVFSPDGRYLSFFPIDITPDQMIFDLQGNLWVVSRDRVIKYVITG